MLEIVLSIGVFTALVLGLVALILAVRSRLVVTGPVEITVNDTRRIEPQAGTRLLAALAEAGIFLPSACGGVGTCGQCRIEIAENGGAPLPIERARIAKRDLDRGTRLACQVIVKGDMAVRVPEEIFGVETWRCEVRANRNVTPLIKELLLDLPEGVAPSFRAGGYVQITCPPYRAKFTDFDIDPGRSLERHIRRLRQTVARFKAHERHFVRLEGPPLIPKPQLGNADQHGEGE